MKLLGISNIVRVRRTAAGLAALLLIGCQREISGKYLAKFSDGVLRMDLVKTPDNHVSGQLTIINLDSEGKVTQHNVNLNGAIDGNNVVLSSTTLGVQVLSFSGTLAGNRLSLTSSDEPGVKTLVRSELKDYQKEVDRLNAQSRQILAAKAAAIARVTAARAQRDLISQIDRIISQMQQFEAEADVHLNRFPGAEQRLHEITSKMSDYVNRERQLAGNPNAAVARGQLGIEINQASIATDQYQNSIGSLKSSLQTHVQTITVVATNLEAACRSGVPPGDLTSEQMEVRKAGCDRLFSADGPYREKLDAITRGLAHVEQVYGEERRAQEGLVQTAQRFQ